MKVLIINSVCGFGSTGKIVASLASNKDYESLVCYGRKKQKANVNSYKFSSFFDNCLAAISTIVLDNNINVCKQSTKKLIKKIKEYNPDIIHIHNLHGYYINVELLFNFLANYNKPVVWTFHDCWPLTGYCASYDYINCEKFKTKCDNCPKQFSYPYSIFKQRVAKEYEIKQALFKSIKKMVIVTPSKWLKSEVRKSFIKNNEIEVINNGIKIPKSLKTKRKTNRLSIIAVANYWTEEKGIKELEKIVELLDDNIKVTIVGKLKNKQKFKKCNLVDRTDNYEELEELYLESDVFINPTLSDNFPTVNIEALSHGLPIVTYNTGGSPEIIDSLTGIVIEKYNYKEFAESINCLNKYNPFKRENCYERSKKYRVELMLKNYEKIYNQLLNGE